MTRIQSAHLQFLADRARLLARTLGPTHPTTIAAMLILADVHHGHTTGGAK